MEKYSLRSKSGQTLFEIVVALAVIVLVVTGLVVVITTSLRNANFAKNQAEATRLAQDATEWIRAQRDADWDAFLRNTRLDTISEIAWCLPSFSWAQTTNIANPSCSLISGTFQRWAELRRIESNVVQVSSRVSWVEGKLTHFSKVDTQLVNIGD